MHAGPVATLSLFDWTPAEDDPSGTDEFIAGLLDMAQAANAPIMNATVCILFKVSQSSSLY